MQETWVQSLGREDPLEKEMATHSSILAWRIPWMEKRGRLQSTGSQRVGHDWSDLAAVLCYWLDEFWTCWSWNPDTLATCWKELTHWKRPWCWERLKAGEEEDDRGWDGWMTSLSKWTWVCINSRNLSWTGRPGVLWSMGSQRLGHDWATELNWMFCRILQWNYLGLKIYLLGIWKLLIWFP